MAFWLKVAVWSAITENRLSLNLSEARFRCGKQSTRALSEGRWLNDTSSSVREGQPFRWPISLRLHEATVNYSSRGQNPKCNELSSWFRFKFRTLS